MPTTIEWFGTATFRIRTGGRTLFFDAYLDRLPGLEPVGLSTAAVTEAHFVFVSHAHFDHLAGADVIALGTGATVVASPESARCLRACGVPEDQLLVVTGGETVDCGPSVRVRVLPALHSCLFAHSDRDSSVPCLGDLGVSAQSRATSVRALFDLMANAPEPAGGVLRAMNERCSGHDGGQLAFLLYTAEGSVLVERERGLLARHLRWAAPRCRTAVAGRPAECGRRAVPRIDSAVRARAGTGAATRQRCLLPSRPALPRRTRRRHRPGRGRGARPHVRCGLLRARVRHGASAVHLSPPDRSRSIAPAPPLVKKRVQK